MRWDPVENVSATAEALRSEGYELAAVETTLRAVDIFDWQPRFPVLFCSATRWMVWVQIS